MFFSAIVFLQRLCCLVVHCSSVSGAYRLLLLSISIFLGTEFPDMNQNKELLNGCILGFST